MARDEPAEPEPALAWRRVARAVALPAAVTVVVLLVVPATLGHYWIFLLTSGVVAIPIMQSLGVITGRVGVISLCQMSFAMIGAWVVGWCNVAEVPGGFAAWMVLAGLAAVPAGLLIGLPALRLRGVNLAIATFTFATAVDVVFGPLQYPGAENFSFVTRPAGFTSDGGYFRFAVIVVALLFVALALLDRSRLGASWLELRYSERGAAAHGTNVARGKLAAFAVSAFIGGVGGALLVGQAGSTTPTAFSSQISLTYFAIAVVIGVRHWDAAVIAGLTGALMPVLMDAVHVPQAYVKVLFGVLAVLVIAEGRGQLGQSEIIRARRQAKLARQHTTAARPPATVTPRTPRPDAAGDHDRPTALEIRDLTVRFGTVTAVDDVSFAVPKGSVVGLIGPNGAGKSTLINAATGFTPCTGSVFLDGKPITGPPHRRARAGLRRSFQQLRVPPTLTAGRFVSTAAGRTPHADELAEYLDWFGCPPAHLPIGTMDVGSRRMLEVAGLVAGRPSMLLLDEPAAGQGARERRLLGGRIAQIPERTGTSVLLVEHDLELVRLACESLIVIDFGRVIAHGDPESVLADPEVVRAYLGSAEAPSPGRTPVGN
ncbi:ABC transporter permease subunit [Pseudonocardia acaciae]|uniref:branched-chain amino acid ABC transporter ATP-binding protein/permease n=1 Tax=Pseudonocardia acaciae TaxID=551276 RepID=UPI0006868D0C|nr:ATP-binding cassette domain-containing protein [Pseudonocardia acaciae]